MAQAFSARRATYRRSRNGPIYFGAIFLPSSSRRARRLSSAANLSSPAFRRASNRAWPPGKFCAALRAASAASQPSSCGCLVPFFRSRRACRPAYQAAGGFALCIWMADEHDVKAVICRFIRLAWDLGARIIVSRVFGTTPRVRPLASIHPSVPSAPAGPLR